MANDIAALSVVSASTTNLVFWGVAAVLLVVYVLRRRSRKEKNSLR